MKITTVLLSSLLCAALLPLAADAAAKRSTHRRASGGGGGGGLYLQTPTPVTALDHNNRGVELGGLSHWPDAIKEHEIALSMQPGNKEFRTNLSAAQQRYGTLLLKKGDRYGAMQQFRGALFVDPANQPADDELDHCYEALNKNALDPGYRRKVAEEMETSGHYEDAIVEFRKVIKMEESGKSHCDLGRALLKAGKTVDGYQELTIGVSKNWPTTTDGRVELAGFHMMLADTLKDFAFKAHDRGDGARGMRRLLNASVEYRRAATLNPANASAIQGLIECSRTACSMRQTFDNYLMLGGAYVLAGDFPHAKIAYDQCYKVDPRNPALVSARIAYYQQIGRSALASPELVAETIGKLDKALSTDQDNARMWYIMGLLKQRQGDTNGALEAYGRAEKLNYLVDPDLQRQIRVLGGQSSAPNIASAAPGGNQGQNPGSSAGTPTSATPQVPATNMRNMATYARVEGLMSNDPDGALNLLNEALQRTPDDGHLYLLKGACLRKKGDQDKQFLDEAAAQFRQAAAFKEPDAEDALRAVNTIRVQENLSRADEYTTQNDLVKASNEIGDAIIKAPNLSMLHQRQAELLKRLGDTKGAEKELAKAADIDKPKPTAVAPKK